jgi:hypothetical protein
VTCECNVENGEPLILMYVSSLELLMKIQANVYTLAAKERNPVDKLTVNEATAGTHFCGMIKPSR